MLLAPVLATDPVHMTHYSRLVRIVLDTPAETHPAEVAFWRGALDIDLTRYERYPEYHGADLPGDGMGLLVQQLGDGPARIHLDIHTSDRRAEVVRLTALGAGILDDTAEWTVMRDPAGLLFCVVQDSRVGPSNAHAW
jgi:hypothetical protein